MVKGTFKSILPLRELDSHKGDYGHLLVLAGSIGMTGAAYLCARAGVLTGSGLVTLAIPKSLNSIMEVKLTEVMTLPCPETRKQTFSLKALKNIRDLIPRVSGLAIGPGISRNSETGSLIKKLIKHIDKPFVLDADAINILAGQKDILKKVKAECVLTPHPGEMAGLTGRSTDYIQKNRKKTAVALAKKYNLTVVLKGYQTLVADSAGRVFVNKTGNPGMATGGTGDILTGIIGSLLSQGVPVWDSCCLGVYWHGLAGDLAAKDKGQVSLCATDLLNKLPEAFKKIN